MIGDLLAADSAITSPWVTGVVALIVGVFGGGGIAALLRVPADRGKVVIEAAQGAVIVQSSVIDDLLDEVARVKAEMATLRQEHRRELTALRQENEQLRRRIGVVEHEQDER